MTEFYLGAGQLYTNKRRHRHRPLNVGIVQWCVQCGAIKGRPHGRWLRPWDNAPVAVKRPIGGVTPFTVAK